MVMEDKKLRTIKKAHLETGSSIGFFKKLLREGKLTRFKINRATYVSMTEFENIAQPTSGNHLKGQVIHTR